MKNKYILIFIAWIAFLAIEYLLAYFLSLVSNSVIPLFIDRSAPDGDVGKAITMIGFSSTAAYYIASLISFIAVTRFMLKTHNKSSNLTGAENAPSS